MMKEVMTLRKLEHPNIVQLFECYEYNNQFSIVVDLCTGGELFDKLYTGGALRDADAATVIRCLLQALAHCHAQKVMHRDIKPENVLLEEGQGFGTVKLADFGSAHWLTEGELASGLVGTPYYVAPEVVRSQTDDKVGYDEKADIWSIGALAYVLLSGVPCFDGDTDTEITDAVVKGEYDFDEELFEDVSQEAKDFIARLLVPDRKKRPSAAQALEDPWLSSQTTVQAS